MDRLPTPVLLGILGGSAGNESGCSVGDLGLTPWFGKIPWRRAWQPTPVFLPAESVWTEKPGEMQSMGLQRVGNDPASQPDSLPAQPPEKPTVHNSEVKSLSRLRRFASLPGSSVHGIFQVRILDWVTVSFSRGSSQCRD